MTLRQLALLPDPEVPRQPTSSRPPLRRVPGYPSPGRVRVSPEMEIGKAGEYLALADLLLNGWVAYPTSQGVPYDVAVDIGERVIRVQVKSTLLPKSGSSMNRGTPLYIFSVRRAGKSGKRRYGSDDFDILALVALDRRLIAYYSMHESPHDTIAIRVPGLCYGSSGVKPRQFEDASFERALTDALSTPKYVEVDGHKHLSLIHI